MNNLDCYYVYIIFRKPADSGFPVEIQKLPSYPLAEDINALLLFPTVCESNTVESMIENTISLWKLQRPKELPQTYTPELTVHHIYVAQKGIVLSNKIVKKIVEAGLSFEYRYTHFSFV